MTVYYTCTVDSRTDPKSGTVFFSLRFHASTHHCRYYCLFLAVNYKSTLPRLCLCFSSSVLVHRPRPTSSGHQRPQYRYLVPETKILSFYSFIFSQEIFRSMAIRRIRAKTAAKAVHSFTGNTSAPIRRAQPRTVAVAECKR